MKFLSITLSTMVPFNSMAHQASSFTEMAAVALDSGVNLSWTTGHGCWCPAVYDESSLKGSPVDPADKACKDFKQCRNCVGKDVDSACTNSEVFNFNWEVGSAAVCTSDNDACELMVCQYHINLFNTLLASNASVTIGTEDLCVAAQGDADGCCHAGGGKWSVFDTATQECENGTIITPMNGTIETETITGCDTDFNNLPTPLVEQNKKSCGYVLSGLVFTRADVVGRNNLHIDYPLPIGQGAGYLSSLSGVRRRVPPQYRVDSFHKKVLTTLTFEGCKMKLYSDVCEAQSPFDYVNLNEECFPAGPGWDGMTICHGKDQDFTDAVYYTCECENTEDS